MSTARINLNVLKAVSTFASREESRYYLGGVLVEFHDTYELYVATDGHRMFVYKDEHDAHESGRKDRITDSLIIPLSSCAPFKRTARQLSDNPYVILEGPGGIAPHMFREGDDCVSMKPIDGTFPDFRRILPGKRDDELDPVGNALCFNWNYMADFGKAGKTLDLGVPSVVPVYSRGPAWVSYGRDHVFGVIMPIRGADDFSKPDWVDQALASEPTAMAAE